MDAIALLLQQNLEVVEESRDYHNHNGIGYRPYLTVKVTSYNSIDIPYNYFARAAPLLCCIKILSAIALNIVAIRSLSERRNKMANIASVVGSVVSLWRYPVKSMMGEELNATYIAQQGLLGDRAYAMVDAATGFVVSAKNPRRWGKMFDCRAELAESPHQDKALPAVKMTLPDGTLVMSDAVEVNQLLSRVLGREVKLETAAPSKPSLQEYWPTIEGLPHQDTVTDEATLDNTFFDLATVHLLTTATLDRLQELSPISRFETRRFRPNLVIKPTNSDKSFVENDWIGHTLSIGDKVQISITRPCPRCVMTTMAQGELPDDTSILRTAVQHNQGNVGIYGTVVQGGIVRRGDAVSLL